MRLKGLALTGAASALLFLTSASGLFAGGVSAGGVEVGSEPAYSFRTSPVNGGGLASLESLRGKPVLVEFWGTR